METIKEIIKAIEQCPVKTDDSNKITGMLGDKELSISRRLVLNNMNLLPSMDIHVRCNGTNVYGYSGGTLSDEEMVYINRAFITVNDILLSGESKVRNENTAYFKSVFKLS